MDRRNFVKTSLTLATTAAFGPYLLGTEDKSASKLPRFGSGEHVYECDHHWGELPVGYSWQTTHNVAVDAHGLVYISHQGIGKLMDTVLVFDPAGKFVRSFGKSWHGGGHGLDIRKEGNEEFIYLCNTSKNPKVVKTTLHGEIVWSLDRPILPEYENSKTPYSPTNVAFLPNGGFWVADGYGSHYLLKYDDSNKPEQPSKIIGGKGNSDGKFATPHGLWTDTRNAKEPKLVVSDRANARLQYFTLEGEYLSQTKAGTVLFPANIDTKNNLMLVPDLHSRVTLLDEHNQVHAHLGDDEPWRKTVLDGYKVRQDSQLWQRGKFIHPHDACFDATGNLFVVEWVNGGRVNFLRRVS